MVKTVDIEAILARRQEIAAEKERLNTEDSELEIAIRVAQRFGGGAPVGNGADNKLGPPRPENTPSLFEMTESVLRNAIEGGRPGLTGQEIVDHIGKTYWPGVLGRQILPPIYGFAKKGRLHKNKDGVFKLVQNKRAQ